MKYKVLLFQPFLRKPTLSFGKPQTSFEFLYPPKKSSYSFSLLPDSFEKEIQRRKDTTWLTRIRRFFGIPNMRVKLATADMLMTYGSLLITNKPYVTYIETGLALYNYDRKIAAHPIARSLVSRLATLPQCRKLIFMSEAAKKSFFATVRYDPGTEKKLREKSVVIYPVVESSRVSSKKYMGKLRLFFPGQFYMKGGLEVVHAYETLRKRWKNLSLTIVTVTRLLKESDMKYLQSIPGLTLLDATFSEQEMNQFYRSHDILVLPTYREGFGLVLVEALAHAMPIITTDHFATTEMVQQGENGFVYPNHPLKDYNTKTYELFGNLHNPSDFYSALFRLQAQCRLKGVEEFLRRSIEQYLKQPSLLATHSKNSLALYKKRFHPAVIGRQIDQTFLSALQSK